MKTKIVSTKKSFKRILALADKIFGNDKKLFKKATLDSHYILGAKNMFIFFAIYNLEKYGKVNLNTLTQAPKKDYYNELEGEFLREAQKENQDTGELEKDCYIDIFKMFLKQTKAMENKRISIITRNQANVVLQIYDYRCMADIILIYDNYMKKFEIKYLLKELKKDTQ